MLPESDADSDLFGERSLWDIYLKSRSFHKNRFNRCVFWVCLISLSAFSGADLLNLRLGQARPDLSGLFASWANAGLAYAATILGFLLAGFSVLFAVIRPETATLLRQIRRKGEPMDELKLMFINFVGVFVDYAAFVFWCVAYTVAGFANGPFDLVGHYLSLIQSWIPVAVGHLAFVIWGAWFIVLILKLKSFIYNLYQSLLLGLADSLE